MLAEPPFGAGAGQMPIKTRAVPIWRICVRRDATGPALAGWLGGDPTLPDTDGARSWAKGSKAQSGPVLTRRRPLGTESAGQPTW
jgi:hypothetical protein